MENQLQTIDPAKKEEMMQEIYEYLGQYSDLTIDTQTKYDFCADLLKQVKNRATLLDTKRKERTKPLDDVKAIIMADFKQLIEPLIQFETDVKKKMIEFILEQQRLRDEEQKRLDAEAMKKIKETGESEAVVPIVNAPIKTVRTGTSTSTIKENWQVVIVDESLIPREYMTPDLKKLTACAKAGVRDVPGVRYENVGSLSIR
jgi:hypothetical protein